MKCRTWLAGYSYMNGDVSAKIVTGADVSSASTMVAPPAAATMAQMMKTEDYDILNGAVETTSDLMVQTTNEPTAGMSSQVSPAVAGMTSAVPVSPAATGTLPAGECSLEY
jgi:hypothetical protein